MNNKICKAPTYVVEVRELNAPKGSDTPHAVLHTKEPVASLDDCYHVVEHHGQRPMVEVSNSGLKIGLQFDGRKYETASRLTAVIGLIYAEVVCLLRLRDMAHQGPEAPAKNLVPTEQVEVLGKIIRRPRTVNMVGEFMKALAGLGGFPGRKSDGQPGRQSSWHALETLIFALHRYRATLMKCGA